LSFLRNYWANPFSVIQNILKELNRSVSVAPLFFLRVSFGMIMLYSHIRFWFLGWIEEHFSGSAYYFKYYGFEWVEPASLTVMYALNTILILASLAIVLGFQYKLWTFVHLILFAYFQLCDLSYYLNHYYFVLLLNLILLFLPANSILALDNQIRFRPFFVKPNSYAPLWAYLLPKVMISVVYFYAGIAKINYDWLIEALPLKIWLPAHYNMPFIGWLLALPITAYLFSWFGMLYDTLIPFFLWNKRTVWTAYVFVVLFHVGTGLLFQIGIFPMVMIVLTIYFFPIEFHQELMVRLQRFFHQKANFEQKPTSLLNPFGLGVLSFFLLFQLIFPFRYLLYKGNLFWTEEGYRFSWRVMLMEKAGTATFYVKDKASGREGVVDNAEFLNPHQEKQMAMQPDMILQFAHFLAKHYEQKGVENPSVRAQVYVTLNARPSRLLIDPNLDLTQKKDSFYPKDWILHYD
jgi:hypothetical protein